jgi:hypothetical protein
MNEDDLQYHNFDPYDWAETKIIRKYYPHLKNRKVLHLLACIAWTMKDLGWSVALAIEVAARMTGDLIFEESNGSKSVNVTTSTKLLQPDEYKNILSHLIGEKIVRQKIIPTKFGSPPRERLQDLEYLEFTNHDLTEEIWRNF